ncbi:unnamed protein product [Cladocopium goreaui]|uniref:Ribosomal RNA small subunit methyltransferase H n=1 Tax=Cladocopium goreaui TaxID=2562237 RepID=A0A9P1GKM1_9DINO|nr:unnamed protein product [Cladocopium goreaui]
MPQSFFYAEIRWGPDQEGAKEAYFPDFHFLIITGCVSNVPDDLQKNRTIHRANRQKLCMHWPLEKQMMQLPARPSKSLEPDAACFGVVAGSCERVGHHELSSKLLAEMSAVAAIDDKTLSIGFTNAISEANRANYWERALQLFGQVCDMQSDGLSLDTAALGAALAACQTGAAWHQSLAILEMLQDEAH